MNSKWNQQLDYLAEAKRLGACNETCNESLGYNFNSRGTKSTNSLKHTSTFFFLVRFISSRNMVRFRIKWKIFGVVLAMKESPAIKQSR